MGCLQSKSEVTVRVPWTLSYLSSTSRSEWLEWKNCFLTFMDYNYIASYKQVEAFYNYTGSLGEEIAKELFFQNPQDEMKLNVLIFKFDVFYIYRSVIRHRNQSIDDYVQTLKIIAEGTVHKSNVDKVVKEKLLQDFKSKNIFRELKKLALSRYLNDYESLSIHELMFLWDEIDKAAEDPYMQTTNDCHYCGRPHPPAACPASGQMCWSCGEYNHFAKCCLKTYVLNCANCGTNHPRKKCPAYGQECSKCNIADHFSWKCLAEIIECCSCCGRTHINNRQYCAAKDNRCSRCKKVGHFTSLCQQHQNRSARRVR